MTINEVIDLIQNLESRNHSYWNFYTVVIIAICGWVISQQRELVSLEIKNIFIFGNIIFYFINLSIIYGTTTRIEALEDEFIALAKKDRNICSKLKSNLSKPFLEGRLKFTLQLIY